MKMFTDWFSATTPPAAPGVYRCKTQSGRITFRYWNGSLWFTGSVDSPRLALRRAARGYKNAVVLFPTVAWRGLVSRKAAARYAELTNHG